MRIWPFVADALEDPPRRPRRGFLGGVEDEALPRRAERRHRPRRRRAEPLRGGGDPGERLVVVLADLPPVDQRLLDDGAIGTFEAEVLVHGARHAVERRRRAAVARAHRDHLPALVDLLAHPLREAALPHAGFADQRHQPVRRGRPRADLVHRGEDLPPLLVARDHRRRPHGHDPGRERSRGRDGRRLGRRRSRTRRRRSVYGRRHRLFERRRMRRAERHPCPPRVRRELPSLPRLLRQQADDVRRHAERNAVGQARRRDRISFVGAKDVLGVPFPDLLSREDPVNDTAERVQVGRRADVRRELPDLLRRDPAHGPRPRVKRELRRGRPIEPRVVALLPEPREAEVQDVDARAPRRSTRGRA